MAEAAALKPRKGRKGKSGFGLPADIWNDILGGDGVAPKPIVLFGEANFTFTIALASLRTNGSEGITATTYDSQLPTFDRAQATAETQCTPNGKKYKLSDEEIEDNIADVSGLPDFSDNWHTDVDATSIPDWLQVAGKVVWFQCPWTLISMGSTENLIRDFMQEMARKQDIGDILVIGISTHKVYIGRYNIESMLGDGSGKSIINGYRYLGYDKNIIKNILKHGYKHHSDATHDIHQVHNDYSFDTSIQKRR
uniref:25S rRNA (uridine-N(3))-methyltransferase BMT5-like domain-containing protein n=1 Tax=Amphimedon queenslandica TaxID=400682 RepID=A0A1X7V1W1_AMPQE